MKRLNKLAYTIIPSVTPVAGNLTGGKLNTINNFNDLINKIISIGNVAIYLIVAFAVVYIIWYTVQYFIKGSAADGRKEAGSNIIWGLTGLAIILSIWGLVNILVNTFRTNTTTPKNDFPKADFVNNPQ